MRTDTHDRKLKAILREELKEYLRTIGDITEEEKKDLLEWVASGNSVYDNPCCYSDENGYPMDYITTMRVVKDQLENMDEYRTETPKEDLHWDDETDPPY